MNFGISVILYLIKTAVKILVWAFGWDQDSILEQDGHIQEKVGSEAAQAADTEETESQEKRIRDTNLKSDMESKNTSIAADDGQLKPVWDVAFGWKEDQNQEQIATDKDEREGQETAKKDHETKLKQDVEINDEEEKEEIANLEILAADRHLKLTPDVVVTEHIIETENDLGEIEDMLSQLTLSPNQQLHKMAIDQSSSLNKKVKDRQVAIEEDQDILTTSTPLDGQFNFVTPETKHFNKDEETSLLKKIKHQREKIETDSYILECSSKPTQYVTPENKKPSTDEEESTLLKKLKQQREKLDDVDSADGPTDIDLRINTFKQAATVAVEDALAQKLKQQLKKIDDNFTVEDVTTRHEAKSLVEDALGEKLKKQQQKIDGLYEVVTEAVSHREAESLVEDALAEKLKKRREKMEEGMENIDASLDTSNYQKSSLTSWEKGGTLDRKLRKQRKKMAEAGIAQPEASENGEMMPKFQDGDGEFSEQLDPVKAEAVDVDTKLQNMDGNDERMTLLVDPTTQMARTRE